MHSPLADLIQEEIRHTGPMTFARYMELALYHPKFGYYRRGASDVFGIHGDFYTAGQLEPVFGELLSSFAAHLCAASENSFEVLDLGAGQQDLRAALHPWNYRAFDWNTQSLPQRLSGLIVANEFFDALPAHILRRTAAGWREVMVKAASGKFVFDETDDVSPALIDYARLYGAAIPEGGRLEVCFAAAEWIARIEKLLTSSSLLILDYGYEPEELARFPEGTLLGFRRHSTFDDLLASPGTRDLTAHVNFAYLRDQAIYAGLEMVCESSLRDWALGIWDEHELAKRWEQADERWRLQWKQLIFGMGDTFRVLHLRTGKVRARVPAK